jgi:hypothetical protein
MLNVDIHVQEARDETTKPQTGARARVKQQRRPVAPIQTSCLQVNDLLLLVRERAKPAV